MRLRYGYLLAGVAWALFFAPAVAFWQRSIHQTEALAAMEKSEAAFAELLNTRQTIAELSSQATEVGSLQASRHGPP